MIFHKMGLKEKIRREINRLSITLMKIEAAKRIHEERRSKPFSELTLVTALAHIPLFPEHLETIYLNSAMGDLKKTLRFLKELNKTISSKLEYSYILIKRKDIEEAISILSSIFSAKKISYMDLIDKVNSIKNLITEIYAMIRERERA